MSVAPLQATSVIDYAGKLIRQRLAVIRMQRTDPISLRLVHRVNRKSADLVIVIVVTVDDQLVFDPFSPPTDRRLPIRLIYKRAQVRRYCHRELHFRILNVFFFFFFFLRLIPRDPSFTTERIDRSILH